MPSAVSRPAARSRATSRPSSTVLVPNAFPTTIRGPKVDDPPIALRKPLPKIQRRRSKLHGWGVFAMERITKNTRIINYAGQLITQKESGVREDRYLSKGCIWVFRVNRKWSRDANAGGNVARFINHSCVHNCYVQVIGRTIWVRAARTIEPGEELTYDYNTEGDKTIACRCRPNCKTRL